MVEENTRLEYVDIFRGIAILIMISVQIFDYLSVSDIYSTEPYYVKLINSSTWVPPPIFFTFVGGMSVFLMVKKRKEKTGYSNKNIIKDIIKKYFKYLILSFPFTVIMWNLNVWFGWEEAVEGIALSVILTGLFLLIFKKIDYKILLFIIVIMAFFHFYIRQILANPFFINEFPKQIDFRDNFSFFPIFISILLNAFFRGWFSFFNLFPMVLAGIVLIILLRENKVNRALLISFLFLLFSFILHILGIKIDYYQRSLSFTFFAVGEAMLIYCIIYKVFKRYQTNKIFFIIRNFGMAAFFVYIFHYLFILKVLEILKFKDLLSDSISWFLTLPLIILIYFVTKFYINNRNKIPEIIRI